MAEVQSISQAVGALFSAIGKHIARTSWWKTLLWLCWFILAVAMVSAVFGSLQEYESRPAFTYGIVLLILLIIGGICLKRGRLAANL